MNNDSPSAESLLIRALLDEKRKDRRLSYAKYALIGLLGLAYIVFFVFGLRAMGSAVPRDVPYASVVHIQGEIMPGREASAQYLNPLLEKAFEDPGATAVILLINSPGGTPTQSHLVHQRILELKAKHGKRVYAVGEDLLTSGAYLIASAADHIVIDRNTITGSVGVVSRGFGFTGLMDRLGIERRVMTAGESKNLLDPFAPETEEGRLKQAELLESIHTNFIEAVKAGRGERLRLDTPGLFSGTVWVGASAVEAGLVDELGSLSSVKERLGVQALRVYRAPAPLLERLLTNVAVQVVRQMTPEASSSTPVALP